MNGLSSSATELMSRRPPPKIHQPSAAEPSPPTLSLPTNDEALQDGMNRYFACSLRPFSADSMRIWVQVTPAVMPMNTSGAPAAKVVIGSLTVGVDGSIVS